MTVPGSEASDERPVGHRRRAWLAAGVAAAMMLSGCQSGGLGLFGDGGRDTIEDPGPELPPGQLYNEGLAYMNGGKFKQAIKSFEEVDRQHPYSDYARKALVMSAFANYRSGKYDDAVESARRFLSLYPASDDAPYAHYIIGRSYFEQVPDVTRDQQATRRALDSMREIVTNYPDSEYARDARAKILAGRDQLAGKEMQIGRYYLERRDYIAAINRFRVVVTDYQDTRHVEEALYRLTEANLAMGLSSEAQTAAAVLGHNFPDSQWYKDAFALLQGGGLEPKNNPGSWIARAFGRDVG